MLGALVNMLKAHLPTRSDEGTLELHEHAIAAFSAVCGLRPTAVRGDQPWVLTHDRAVRSSGLGPNPRLELSVPLLHSSLLFALFCSLICLRFEPRGAQSRRSSRLVQSARRASAGSPPVPLATRTLCHPCPLSPVPLVMGMVCSVTR